MACAFIAAGSNIEPARHVRRAAWTLAREVHIVAISTIYATRPLRHPEQPLFYNGIIEIETPIPPRALKFEVLRPIEARLGRVRSADRWAARTIDLDIVLYDNLVIAEENLEIPDPDITRRAFLAVPLAELAPDLVLPGDGRTLQQIAASFADHDMEALPEYTRSLKEEMGV